MDHRSGGVPYLEPYVILSASAVLQTEDGGLRPSGLARGPPAVKSGKQLVLLVTLCQGCNQEKGGALETASSWPLGSIQGNRYQKLRGKTGFSSF